MTGNRRILRGVARLLFLAALIAVIMPMAAKAAWEVVPIRGVSTERFPERIQGNSIAIGPDGTPSIGIRVEEGGPSIAHLVSGRLEFDPLLDGERSEATTSSLRFGADGSIWVAQEEAGRSAIVRKSEDGAVTVLPLPMGEPVNEMTIGPEGDSWFVRGGYEEGSEATVGRVSASGAVTQFPLEPGSRPVSITAGPDGALWFSEEQAGRIGRITANGEIRLFNLAPKAQPRQIVSGPDGALWFGENGRARRYGKVSDRIGRITVGGAVSEFSVPFDIGTSRLVADPRGVVWFATDNGELSSISPSGNVGAVGCVHRCEDLIEGLAVASDGALWFATGNRPCGNCGGSSGLMAAMAGTEVGRIPVGALTSAEPDGPPAVDRYASPPTRPPLPIVRTGGPVEVDVTAAAVTGYVDPRGYLTTWRFRWGRTKAYGHFTSFPERPFGVGQRGAGLEEFIYGLCPDRTYHYELVAYGSGGRAVGGDRTFTTEPSKHPPKRCGAR